MRTGVVTFVDGLDLVFANPREEEGLVCLVRGFGRGVREDGKGAGERVTFSFRMLGDVIQGREFPTRNLLFLLEDCNGRDDVYGPFSASNKDPGNIRR